MCIVWIVCTLCIICIVCIIYYMIVRVVCICQTPNTFSFYGLRGTHQLSYFWRNSVKYDVGCYSATQVLPRLLILLMYVQWRLAIDNVNESGWLVSVGEHFQKSRDFDFNWNFGSHNAQTCISGFSSLKLLQLAVNLHPRIHHSRWLVHFKTHRQLTWHVSAPSGRLWTEAHRLCLCSPLRFQGESHSVFQVLVLENQIRIPYLKTCQDIIYKLNRQKKQPALDFHLVRGTKLTCGRTFRHP